MHCPERRGHGGRKQVGLNAGHDVKLRGIGARTVLGDYDIAPQRLGAGGDLVKQVLRVFRLRIVEIRRGEKVGICLALNKDQIGTEPVIRQRGLGGSPGLGSLCVILRRLVHGVEPEQVQKVVNKAGFIKDEGVIVGRQALDFVNQPVVRGVVRVELDHGACHHQNGQHCGCDALPGAGLALEEQAKHKQRQRHSHNCREVWKVQVELIGLRCLHRLGDQGKVRRDQRVLAPLDLDEVDQRQQVKQQGRHAAGIEDIAEDGVEQPQHSQDRKQIERQQQRLRQIVLQGVQHGALLQGGREHQDAPAQDQVDGQNQIPWQGQTVCFGFGLGFYG